MIYLKTRVLYLSLEDDWSNTQAKSLLLRNPLISNLLEFFNRIVLGSDVKFTQRNKNLIIIQHTYNLQTF